MKKLGWLLLLAAFVVPHARAQSVFVPQGFAPIVCVDSSGSATAQSCNTVPPFTVVAGSSIVYKTNTTNTGDLTINVNSGTGGPGVIHVRKFQSSATLDAGDIQSGVYIWLLYDGTYWEIAGKTIHTIGYTFGDANVTGAPTLNTNQVGYLTVDLPCTIVGWHIMVDAGTLTFKVGRLNGGTANPTIASNSITTNGESISSGTKVDSTTVSDFTSTAIAANDTLVFAITTVATAKQATVEIKCAQQ